MGVVSLEHRAAHSMALLDFLFTIDVRGRTGMVVPQDPSSQSAGRGVVAECTADHVVPEKVDLFIYLFVYLDCAYCGVRH